MKSKVYMMIALMVLIGSMAVAAQAQNGSRAQLVADVPFEFSVDNKTMPAGEYTVRQVNPSSDRVVLQIRSRDGKASAMIQMNGLIDRSNGQETAHLRFNRYGNQYFFAEAWMPGQDGLAAAKGSAERSAQREMAGKKPQAETIALRNR